MQRNALGAVFAFLTLIPSVSRAQDLMPLAGSDGLYCKRQGTLGEVVKPDSAAQMQPVNLALERKSLLRILQTSKKQLAQAQAALALARKKKGKQRQNEIRQLSKKIEKLSQTLAEKSALSELLDRCELGTLLPPLTSCFPLGSACDDGNSCTSNDSCTATGCTGTPFSGESIKCGVGACERSMPSCLNGSSQICIPGTPISEVCNGYDDDCDGVIDEDLGQTSCGVGACATTVENCVRGHTRTCFPKPPIPGELCNGVDDNCNGVIDEGACPPPV